MKVKVKTMGKVVIPNITEMYGFEKEKKILKSINFEFLIFSNFPFFLRIFPPVF